MTTYEATITESWVTYEFVWHTAMDDRVCPFCQRLEGEQWTSDKLEGVLNHPEFGPVWDLDADVSLAHRGAPDFGCRCFLEVRPIVELEKIESFKILQSTLKEFGYAVPNNIKKTKSQIADLQDKILTMDLTTRQFERLIYRSMAVARKFGLPETIDEEITRFETLVMIARMASMSMSFLQMATPYGWTMGLMGLAISGFGVADLLTSS